MTEAEQIEKFIAERGVTKCEPGFAAPTSISIPPGTVKFATEKPVTKAAAFKKRQRWSHQRGFSGY